MANDDDGVNIMDQVFVAFGQGIGSMRVSRSACAALRRRYMPMHERDKKLWADEGDQALERIRTLGRKMATDATSKGRTDITDEGFSETAQIVEAESATKICNG
jgi:hypothetical protein